jgi:hypothetical protein
MSPDDHQRVLRIKQYVLARLRDELASSPRGGQARLAKRLGVSGAHLSNMLSPSPSRQPGEDFRRKVAAHWGVSYAQLEALALGEDAPDSMAKPLQRTPTIPPNLEATLLSYDWMAELPGELRELVRAQAQQHHTLLCVDYALDEWQRILTGLEREALGLVARMRSHSSIPASGIPERPTRKARKRA